MRKRLTPFHFSFIDKVFFIYIITLSLSLVNIKYFENNFKTIYLQYAEKEALKISNNLINNIVSEELELFGDISIINYIENENGEIKMLDFNSKKISSLVNSISNKIYDQLLLLENAEIEEKNTIFYIPMGIISNNSLISNTGPLIPAKLNFIGDVFVEPICNIESYGINNSLLTVILNIEIGIQMILPLVSNTIKVNNNFPLAVKYIQGEIPEGIIGGILSS